MFSINKNAIVPALKNYALDKKPKISQRDSYAKAMAGATKLGGSNGIGVGGNPVSKALKKKK